MNRTLALWTGLLTGPIVWFISLEAKFALAPWVCAFHWKPAVYMVSLVAFLVTAAAGLLSWNQWRQLSAEHSETGDSVLARPRIMALGGVMLSAGFFVVLAAQSLPELLLAGCE
jgi:hypothetical protein